MWTRLIYPFWLREKISRRIEKVFPRPNAINIPLALNNKVHLDLSSADTGHRQIIFNGFYEWQVTRRIAVLAKKGGVLVDVGANYGYYTCLFAAMNQQNIVHAFEASPLNIGPLNHNVLKNGFSKRVFINTVAVGKETGALSFNLHNEQGQSGWGGLSLHESNDSIVVEMETLDRYAGIHNMPVIDVLKIDTEGADTWVLKGAKDLLERKRIHHIFFEENLVRMKMLGIEQNEARTFLASAGYTVTKISSTECYAFPAGTQ